MLVPTKSLSAYPIYLIYSGASALFLGTIFTVNLVYQIQVAHLTPLQLVLVGTVLEIVCFFCQVPTGVLADVYSRRLAVIVGFFAIGAGFVLEGSIPSFPFILLAQVLWGIGATLTDGAEQAWITGELGEDDVGHAFLRSTQVGLVGGLLGACVGVSLASIRLNLPIVLGGASMAILGVFLLLFMPEHGFQPTPKQERQSWREMGNTLRTGLRVVRRSTVLLTIFSIELFYGLSSEGYDRLSTAHFLADFTFPALGSLKPVVWFAIFSVAGTLLSLLVTELVKRRVDTNNARLLVMTLFTMNALNVLSILLFALTGTFSWR
jgi:DHA3 family tetracycline resistance protein-like MFS transporter